MAQRGGDEAFLLKIVLTGESGVGKTNILSQFVRSNFNANAKTTIGVECATKTIDVDSDKVKIQIWDTAGQERFRAITTTYYHGAHGALLVYDVTNGQSFKNAARWLKELRDYGEDGIPVVLVGNKVDLEASRSVPQDDGSKYAETEHLLFFETSAKTGTNVHEAIQALAEAIVRAKKGSAVAGAPSGAVAINATPGIVIDGKKGCPC